MNKEFEVHRLNEKGIKLAGDIAKIFDDMLNQLSTYVPYCDAWKIVRSKLEEACFYAKKAMASDPKNQDDIIRIHPYDFMEMMEKLPKWSILDYEYKKFEINGPQIYTIGGKRYIQDVGVPVKTKNIR
jgi:hypothetical protein